MEPGPGVDLVARNPYRYPLSSASADPVVCGQTFDQMVFLVGGWTCAASSNRAVFSARGVTGSRAALPGGLLMLLPDGFQALAKWAGVKLLDLSTDWPEDLGPGSAPLGDAVGVFRRYRESTLGRLRRYLLRKSLAYLSRP